VRHVVEQAETLYVIVERDGSATSTRGGRRDAQLDVEAFQTTSVASHGRWIHKLTKLITDFLLEGFGGVAKSAEHGDVLVVVVVPMIRPDLRQLVRQFIYFVLYHLIRVSDDSDEHGEENEHGDRHKGQEEEGGKERT